MLLQSKQEELLAIGFAQEGGIRVPNVSGLLGFTGFEGLTKSNYHRPCQFTYAPNSISLQVCHVLCYDMSIPCATVSEKILPVGVSHPVGVLHKKVLAQVTFANAQPCRGW